jgi:hypothetical protein
MTPPFWRPVFPVALAPQASWASLKVLRTLFASARDDALVVVEKVEVYPGIAALAWLAMIKVRT